MSDRSAAAGTAKVQHKKCRGRGTGAGAQEQGHRSRGKGQGQGGSKGGGGSPRLCSRGRGSTADKPARCDQRDGMAGGIRQGCHHLFGAVMDPPQTDQAASARCGGLTRLKR